MTMIHVHESEHYLDYNFNVKCQWISTSEMYMSFGELSCRSRQVEENVLSSCKDLLPLNMCTVEPQ